MHAKEQERRVPPNAALSTSQKFLSLSSSCCDSCAILIVLVILEVQQESRTRRNQAHRNLLCGNACTYDTRCCGKRCVHSLRVMDDRAMSACGARSSGPGIPLPALSAVARLQLQLNSRLANLVIGIHRANQHFSGESVTLPWLTQSVLVQVSVRPRTSAWHSLLVLLADPSSRLFECSRPLYVQAVPAAQKEKQP